MATNNLLQANVEKTLNTLPVGTYLEDEDGRVYTFQIITSETISSSTDYTDHYLEDGSVTQDHASNLPVTYTLSGLIAERCWIFNGLPSATDYVNRCKMQDALRKFATLGQLAPKYSGYVYSAINVGRAVINKVTNIIKAVEGFSGFGYKKLKMPNITIIEPLKNFIYKNIPDGVTGLFGLTKDEYNQFLSDMLGTSKQDDVTNADQKTYNEQAVRNYVERNIYSDVQERAYKNFEKLRVAHNSLKIHSPYGVLENMHIIAIECGQRDTATVSDITVTLKQIRTVPRLNMATATDAQIQKASAPKSEQPSTVKKAPEVKPEKKEGFFDKLKKGKPKLPTRSVGII